MSVFKASVLILSLMIFNLVAAQDQTTLKKSEEVKEINGSLYYIHHVEKGNTLYSISRLYDISVEEILLENQGVSGDLAIGQILKIPAVSREAKVMESLNNAAFDFFYHVAKQGESFKDIGKIYMIPGDNIRAVNPDIKEPIPKGQYVKVPVSFKAQDDAVQESKPGQIISEPNDPASSSNYLNHQVKHGENLYRLSKLYNCKIEDILALNPGLTNNLAIGQMIKIPRKGQEMNPEQQPDKDPKEYIEHVVQSGDNLYRIALFYKVSIDTLRNINPGLTEKLSIGQVIRVPVNQTNRGYILHKVEGKKEKLNKLAKKYGLGISELREINPRLGNRLYRGQLIKIPVEVDIVSIAEHDTTNLNPDILEKKIDEDSVALFRHISLNQYKTYQVALMLPLYLEEIDSINLDDVINYEDLLKVPSFHFLQFYEGFQLAVATLQEQGLNLKLYVYDVDQDISKTIQVLQEPEMTEMDLIIGPLFSKSFELTSNFARLFNIKIVNPLTNRTEVLDKNPHVFKIQPSIEKEIEQTISFIIQSFPDAKIILVKENQYQYNPIMNKLNMAFSDSIKRQIGIPNYVLYNQLIEKSQSEQPEDKDEVDLLASIQIEEKLIFSEDFSDNLEDTTYFRNYISEVVYMQDSIQGIINHASVVRDNVLVTFSENRVFVLDLLTNLNVLRDTFDLKVVGLPNWESYFDYAPEKLANINSHLFVPGNINYHDSLVNWFVTEFRNRYQTEPDAYAFDGFDIGYYFLNALMNFGTDFQKYLSYYSPSLLQTQFIFHKPMPAKGYENMHWSIIKFEDFQVKEIPNSFVTYQLIKAER